MTDPLATPENRRHWPSEAGLVVLLVLALMPWMLTSEFRADEFTLLSDTLRQTRGQVIYRDFFQFITPLSEWLLVPIYSLFGPSLLAARILQILVVVLSGWQLYCLARRLAVAPWVATLPALALGLGLYPLLPGFSHHWMVLPFVLGGLQAGLRWLDDVEWQWAGLAGAAVAGALLCVQSDGLVLLCALVATAIARLLLGDRPSESVGPSLAAFSGGLAGPLSLVAVFFAWHGALSIAWYDVWTWTLHRYQSAGNVNDVPFASDLVNRLSPVRGFPAWYGRAYYTLFLYAQLPIMMALAGAWWANALWRRARHGVRLSTAESHFSLAAMAALGFGLLAMRGRADLEHIAVYSVPAVLLGVVVARQWAAQLTAPAWSLGRWLPLGAFAAFVVTGGVLNAKIAWASRESWLSAESPDARLAALPLVRHMRALSAEGDRIAVVPYGGLYHFYVRPPATRYTIMLPEGYRYNTQAEIDELFQQAMAQRAKLIMIGPFPGAALGYYNWTTLPGYRCLPEPPFSRGSAMLFERIDAKQPAERISTRATIKSGGR